MQFLDLSDGFYKRVLDSMLEGCQIISFDWVYLYINPSTELHSRRDRSELLGKSFAEVWPGIESSHLYNQIRECLENRVASEFENEFLYPDGTRGWFQLRVSPILEGAFIMSIDITQKKELETLLSSSREQLHQSQKLESIGRLAAGVAHDFNNLLSVILGRTELAMMSHELGECNRMHMLEIQKAAESSARLTRQLLTFARRQTILPRELNLNDSVDANLSMIRSLVGSQIQVNWNPDQNLASTFVDPSQFEQILLNLCINARDAIDTNGMITIETANAVVDDQYVLTHPGAILGDFVQLSISDNGCGIASDIIADIFDPFYTTKLPGTGTGLGLSIVYGNVRQSNGFINVYSVVGSGTTFQVYLPRISGVGISHCFSHSSRM